MRKADYKNAIYTLKRAEKYGTKMFSHPLAPGADTVRLARAQINNMRNYRILEEFPFTTPRRAPLKRRIYS